MKKNWKKYLAVVLILLVCAAGAGWVSWMDDQSAADVISGYDYGARNTGAMLSKSTAYDMAAEETVEMGFSGASPMTATGATYPEARQPRKLVRTADLTLRTRTFEKAAQQIEALLKDAGGYVESLYEQGEEGYRHLNLYLRVPSDKLDSFLASMEGAGRITNRSQSTTDMTTQYQDNEARLKTLYDKRDRLNALMLRAETVADLIEIESAIADTQYEIDRWETSQRSIDREVDMSAVSVNLIEDRPSDTAQADLSLWERIVAGLHASVEGMGEFLRDLAVFLAVALPWAVPVIVILVIIRIIRKRKKAS